MSKICFAKFGNSQVSAWKGRGRVYHFTHSQKKDFKNYLQDFDEIFFSSVLSDKKSWLPKDIKHFILSPEDIPLKPAYRETLGVDRLLNAYSALSLSKSKRVLVLDVGTALCVEFAMEQQHLGGWISCGPGLAAEALAEKTSALPYVAPVRKKLGLGNSTQNSLLLGQQSLVIGHLEEAKKWALQVFKRRKFEIFITGGWSNIYDWPSGCRVEANLGLLGLKKIWESRTIGK